MPRRFEERAHDRTRVEPAVAIREHGADVTVDRAQQEAPAIVGVDLIHRVREKRHARSLRKAQRQRDRDAGIEIEHQVEDLSHLDVAVVAGVEPDVTVKR